jgi:hypothetical protein
MLNALVLLPALALAEQPEPPPASATQVETSHETTAIAGLGAMGGVGTPEGDSAGGLAMYFTLLHRISFVELGGELYGATTFGGRIGSLGGLLGAHIGSEFSVRAFAAAGVHGYSAVGYGLLSDDPGVSGSSPYVGGRVMIGYSFPFPRRSRLFIGALTLVDEDLERQQKSVAYTETHWLFGGDPTWTTDEHSVGQTTWGALVVAGFEFDFASY